MTRARALVIALYALIYSAEVIAGFIALDRGHNLDGVVLLTAAIGPVLAIHRECGLAGALMLATGPPPARCCAPWRIGLPHDLSCPALIRKNDR